MSLLNCKEKAANFYGSLLCVHLANWGGNQSYWQKHLGHKSAAASFLPPFLIEIVVVRLALSPSSFQEGQTEPKQTLKDIVFLPYSKCLAILESTITHQGKGKPSSIIDQEEPFRKLINDFWPSPMRGLTGFLRSSKAAAEKALQIKDIKDHDVDLGSRRRQDNINFDQVQTTLWPGMVVTTKTQKIPFVHPPLLLASEGA